MKKRLVMIAGVCVCTLIAAAGLYQNYSKNEKYQKQLFAMDTYMEFTAYGRGGQQAVEKAAKEVQRLDALLSAQNEESQVYALNQRGSLEVSDDLAEIIQRGKEIFQETDGLLTIRFILSWSFGAFLLGSIMFHPGKRLRTFFLMWMEER